MKTVLALYAILAALDRDIAYLDRLLSEQVDAILHHPRFQKLEASWRGVEYLVDQADDEPGVKIKILDISWAEVTRDMERAIGCRIGEQETLHLHLGRRFDGLARFELWIEDHHG